MLRFLALIAISIQLGPSASAAVVTVHGGAGQVSGSLTELQISSSRYLIDCGADYGDGEGDAAAANSRLPVDAKKIDGVFLTHAHLDHAGRLPLLVRNGFKGPVWVTRGTAALLPVMMRMAVEYSSEPRNWRWSTRRVRKGESGAFVKAHWHGGCRFAKQIAPSNLQTIHGSRRRVEDRFRLSLDACEECVALELNPILALLRPIPYGQPIPLAEGARATLRDAGHIPGSASVIVDLLRPSRKTLVFTGDIGNENSTLIAGPRPLESADAVWIESTYGGADDPGASRALDEFPTRIEHALRENRIVWIPAFALDRTQKVLFEIARAQRKGTISKTVPIVCASRAGRTLTGLYKSELREASTEPWFRRDTYGRESFAECTGSKVPQGGPAIVVTSSGMLDAGSSAALLDDLLPRPDVTVMLVGYQAHASPGGQLKARPGAPLSWNGKRIQVRANVITQSGFSAHIRYSDVLRYLAGVRKSASITLVHGDPERLTAFKRKLQGSGYTNVHIAAAGERVTVE